MKKNVYTYTLLFAFIVLFSSGCISQKMTGTVRDIDGNIYNTVQVGDQIWMKENLRTTRFNDGTPIPNVTDITEWRHCDSPAYVWYDNDIIYKEPYGALYNWHAVGDGPSLCPSGWHVPTDDEWKTLEMYLGMTREQADGTVWRGTDQGGKIKEAGTEHWVSPNTGATNESGLAVIGAGRRFTNGLFGTLDEGCTIWSSTPESLSSAAYRHFATGSAGIGRNPGGEKKFGFTVRCIKDDF